jgi:hypothetical protein
MPRVTAPILQPATIDNPRVVADGLVDLIAVP